MVERARWPVIFPRVARRHTGLAAPRWDDRPVQAHLPDALAAVREQVVHDLAGPGVHGRRLRRADELPGGDGVADQLVDRLGERPASSFSLPGGARRPASAV
jgi:hypothetical protein